MSRIPPNQAALAKKYGKQYGVDPLLLLAIAGHETEWGRIGAGRPSQGGYVLGYGVTDSGIISKYRGVENQYKWAARTLSHWGVHTIQDVMAGKAAAYATSPTWEQGVASVYSGISGTKLPDAPTAPPPSGGGAWNYPKMRPAGKDMRIPGYAHLKVAAHADYAHISPVLLFGLEHVAEKLGVTVTVFSGYRDPAYSASVGGYANDPHSRGVAVDANIGDTPIGSYPGAFEALQAAGLESGASPGFYRGKTDPTHVQIPGSGVDKSINANNIPGTKSLPVQPGPEGAPPAGPQQPAQPEPVAPIAPAPVFQPQAQLGVVPELAYPGQPDPSYMPRPRVADTWQLLASQPDSSPDTQAAYQHALLTEGG